MIDQITAELQLLMAYKPVSGNTEHAQLLYDYLEGELFALGLRLIRGENGGFPYIIAGTQSTMRSQILLQAHVDVVPGEPQQFTLTESEGKLYGRGTYDMLFAAACFMVLLRELHELNQLAHRDIGIMFTCDEEVGGKDGVQELLKNYDCGVCILPDAGTNTELCVGSKGVLQLDIIATGVAAHSSRPAAGSNPIEQLSPVIAAILAAYPNTNESETTCVLTRLKSGDAYNQIPHQAIASVDIRYHPDEDADHLESQIRTITKKYGDISLVRHEHGTPFSNANGNKYIEQYKTMMTQNGTPLTEIIEQGSSDARFFAEKGIPVIMQRPEGGGLHGEHEWVDKASLAQFYDNLKQYIVDKY